MMESPSPVSPGGSVLDRVLLFERKERESQLASSPSRSIPKSPRNEQQLKQHFDAPFSPKNENFPSLRRAIAAVPLDAFGSTQHDRGTIPTSPIKSNNHKYKLTTGKSPTSDQTTNMNPQNESPTSDRTPSILRQVVTLSNKSPRQDQTTSNLRTVTFSKSPRFDQISTPNSKVITFNECPKSPRQSTFSNNSNSDKMSVLKPVTSGSKSPKSDLSSNYLKSVTFSKSPTGDQTSNLNLATLRKSPKSDHANFKPFPGTSRPSPSTNVGLEDRAPSLKPFPVTSRAINNPRNYEPSSISSLSSPDISMSPLGRNVQTVRQRRNQFEDLSVNVKHKTELTSNEEAFIEDVAWPSEDSLSKKVATAKKALSLRSEDLTISTEETAVEEMPWPSEGLEEFPELSWISSDDGGKGEHSSTDDYPTEKRVAPENGPTENNTTENTEEYYEAHHYINQLNNNELSQAKLSWQQQKTPALQPSPVDDYDSNKALLDTEDVAGNHVPDSYSKNLNTFAAPSHDIPQQSNGKSSRHEPTNDVKLQSIQGSTYTSEESLSVRHFPTSRYDAAILDVHFSKALESNCTSGPRPLSAQIHHASRMQENLQERDEQTQQRSESPSRATRYTSLSRMLYDDSSAAEVDDSVTVISSVTAKSNLTISTEGSSGFSSRFCQLEEGLRQEVDSPSRTARMKRASRLRSLNSPISTNLIFEKSNELATPVHYNELPDTSDLDGPPKISIEPGKLTAGVRPRSTSPSFVSQQYSSFLNSRKNNDRLTTHLPDTIGSRVVNIELTDNIINGKKISEKDTTGSTADRIESSEQNPLARNAHIFCEGVLQSCNDLSEEKNTTSTTFDEDLPLPAKEEASNQEVFKIPRSIALRTEPSISNAHRGKSFNRASTKSLSGAISHEEDTHSVATDSTPVTRPGRTFAAFEKINVNAQSQALDNKASIIDLKKIDLKKDQDLLPNTYKETQESSQHASSELQTSTSTDELLRLSERPQSLPLSQHGDKDGGNADPFKNDNKEASSVSVASTPFSQLIPSELLDTISRAKKTDNKIQQMKTEAKELPKESLCQPASHTRSDQTEVITPKEGLLKHIMLTESNKDLSLWMKNIEDDQAMKRAQKQQQTSPNRNKKLHRKKTKKRDSCGSPSNGSISSTSQANEHNSVDSLSEDLASWWQSTYAAAQQPEVNHIIEQAILEKAVSPSNSIGKRRLRPSISHTSHAQSSSPYRQSRSSRTEISSPIKFKAASPTGENSSTSSCGNEGDSEGGSCGQIAGSVASSHLSRNSDSVSKTNQETDDDDVFSGIEDDEQTFNSKIDRDNSVTEGSYTNYSLPDNAAGDIISVKDTSTCDDTHTTDLLNSLDDDSSRIGKPILKSPRSSKVKMLSSKIDMTPVRVVPLESTDIGSQPPRYKPQESDNGFQSDDGMQKGKLLLESDDGNNMKTDVEEGSSSSKSARKTSANQIFDFFSCSFLEGFVVQFCQDPKKASSSFIEALSQKPEASTGEKLIFWSLTLFNYAYGFYFLDDTFHLNFNPLI